MAKPGAALAALLVLFFILLSREEKGSFNRFPIFGDEGTHRALHSVISAKPWAKCLSVSYVSPRRTACWMAPTTRSIAILSRWQQATKKRSKKLGVELFKAGETGLFGVSRDHAADSLYIRGFLQNTDLGRLEPTAKLLVLVHHFFQLLGSGKHNDEGPFLVLRQGFQGVDARATLGLVGIPRCPVPRRSAAK